jgi:hypothetical protein
MNGNTSLRVDRGAVKPVQTTKYAMMFDRRRRRSNSKYRRLHSNSNSNSKYRRLHSNSNIKIIMTMMM